MPSARSRGNGCSDRLDRMGYEDVRLVGRAAGGGRNGTGGYDLCCAVSSGTPGASRRTVLVLLKRFGRNAWVFQRMVDELRGVAVREGADEAILITTGRLSPVIAQCEGVEGADPALRTLPPVERIGGDRLHWHLAAYGIQTQHGVSPIPIPISAAKAIKPANTGVSVIAPTPPMQSPKRRETRVRFPQSSAEPLPIPCIVLEVEMVDVEVRVTITR